MNFMHKAQAMFDLTGSEVDSLDLIYQSTDDLLSQANYPELDAIIKETTQNIQSYDFNLLMGLLTISYSGWAELRHREDFYTAVEAEAKRRGIEEEGLMDGLSVRTKTLEDALDIAAAGYEAEAMDVIMSIVMRYLEAGQQDKLGEELAKIDVKAVASEILVCILMATNAMQRRIPNRKEFYYAVKKEIEDRGEDSDSVSGFIDEELFNFGAMSSAAQALILQEAATERMKRRYGIKSHN